MEDSVTRLPELFGVTPVVHRYDSRAGVSKTYLFFDLPPMKDATDYIAQRIIMYYRENGQKAMLVRFPNGVTVDYDRRYDKIADQSLTNTIEKIHDLTPRSR